MQVEYTISQAIIAINMNLIIFVGGSSPSALICVLSGSVAENLGFVHITACSL